MTADPRSASPLSPRLDLNPAYPDVRTEIVRPDLVQVTTRYFWTRWAPKLGARATALLLALRRRCYFNPTTGESRDWCWPSQRELAEELGCERKAVMRAFAKLELHGFVKREATFTRNPASPGFGVSRRADRVQVLMVEPLAPEDHGRAAVLEAERIVAGHGLRPARVPLQRASPRLAKPAPLSVSRCGADQSHNGTHNAVPLRDRNTVDFEEALKPLPPFPLPADRLKRPTVKVPVQEEGFELPPMIAAIVVDLEERLSDPGSHRFFVRLARRLPHDVLRAAASEALDAVHRGRARGSAAAYFTGIVKREARERSVYLGA